jgi:hypothetical protein
MSDENTSSSWSNLRQKTVYEECKQVLDAQKSDIDDLDDKALRTVRITAILLAGGATGIEIIGVGNVNDGIAAVSVFSFLISLVFGVIVYNESDELIGPKASYLTKMRENSMKKSWDDDFLYQLENWVDSNQEIVEFNGYLLMVCQFFFILGVGTGVSALLGMSNKQVLCGAGVLIAFISLIMIGIKMYIGRG